MNKTALMLGLLVFSLTAQAQNILQDTLMIKNLSMVATDFQSVLLKTENNIKPFVDHYEIKLDKGSKITSPKEVTGTQLQPVLKLGIKKCVFVVCEKINVDIEFTLVKTQGPCLLNYALIGDMRRSSRELADNYSHMNTTMCINKSIDGAVAQLAVQLIRSAEFKSGTVQKEILKFFKLQADSIIQSFSAVMKMNGVTEIK